MMLGFFWFAGAPWRATFARAYPRAWALMERAAYARHAAVFGNPHIPWVRAYYRGWR